MTSDTHLLEPGSAPGYAVAGDPAVLAALVRAEVAWVDVLGRAGIAPAGLGAALRSSLQASPVDLASVAGRGADGGNPVIPLVADLRERAGSDGRWVHVGLTSQDVLDSALMLVARDVLELVADELTAAGDALAGLVEAHRGTVMVGRTLTQHAVPITFGLKAAQWLTSVQDGLEEIRAVRAGLPVQAGGAAGTRAAYHLVAGGAGEELGRAWAEELRLTWPDLPWHTRRRPVTRVGDVLAAVLSTLGHLATDVLSLARPEVAEVAEGRAEGRGGSSTMPHKRNPVLSVLVRSAAVQAGPLAGVLHQCAALAVDERSDGAWHAEWPTLQRLMVLAASTAVTSRELVTGLQVDVAAMSARADAAAEALLSEPRGLAARTGRDTDDDVSSYLGSAAALADSAVGRWRGDR
ncbi:lyase family protein [Ornithinimicrobium tianjinense]|uniref:3-carboxy-cis,cis-muconate cycloisomerase n=1 Tax=Ornithinimicrobium tianjinense TaxID=1195761 RepID=A0A917F1E0_9MICO|nr:lyase family protein [Ornithinimicrobium tianjinense]GGF40729.1 3-carboxy-cis,cis-muconate cycloisomerase [Ornithinimicrobium tianjinense]